MDRDLGANQKQRVISNSAGLNSKVRGEGEGAGAHQVISREEDGEECCIGEKVGFWEGNWVPCVLTWDNLISFSGRFLLLTGTRSKASRVESAPSMTLPKIVYLPSKWDCLP